MDILKIILRLIHITSGVFWVGGSLLFAFFVGPSVAAAGEAGQKLLVHLVTKAKVTTAIAASAMLTVLAGGTLYWIDSQGLTSSWQYSGPGIGFGIGGLSALVGLVFGLMVGKNTNTLGHVVAEIQGKPTADQLAKLQAAQKRLAYAGPISSIAMIIALVCMATARYWLF